MMQNMYRALSSQIDNLARSPGFATGTEGSLGSPLLSTSGQQANQEPLGCSGVLKTLARNYATLSVSTDPTRISLVNEKRIDIVQDFFTYIDTTATNSDVIKHIKGMNTAKVS
jgi:hypothetical protein